MPLLAVYADVQAAYGCGAGKKETASLCLKGMRMESQVVQRDQNATDEMVSQLHGGIHRRGAGITQVWCCALSAVCSRCLRPAATFQGCTGTVMQPVCWEIALSSDSVSLYLSLL